MHISDEQFERFVAEGFAAIPEQFKKRINNVVFKVEHEPSQEVQIAEGLSGGDTLLGYYHGVPESERGEHYHGFLPDTIYIYKKPIVSLAKENMTRENTLNDPEKFLERVKELVSDTVWHEIGHHFGLDEDEIEGKERKQGRYK